MLDSWIREEPLFGVIFGTFYIVYKFCCLDWWGIWLPRSGWLEKNSLITSTQSWSGGPAADRRRVAVQTTFSFSCGFLQNILCYLTILAFVSQYCLLYFIRVITECGILRVTFLPSVNFTASDTRKAVAARARKQGDHSFATESNSLER
jgi:hypothetical protein